MDWSSLSFLSKDNLEHMLNDFINFDHVITKIEEINRSIILHGRKNKDVSGMGTTLNCIMFVGDRMYLAHIGDSRTYLFQDGNIFQITLDAKKKSIKGS